MLLFKVLDYSQMVKGFVGRIFDESVELGKEIVDRQNDKDYLKKQLKKMEEKKSTLASVLKMQGVAG